MPNALASMVPIRMVGLVVDYSIQTVAKYREAMNIPSSVQRRRAKASLV